jgi:hypothetical protein
MHALWRACHLTEETFPTSHLFGVKHSAMIHFISCQTFDKVNEFDGIVKIRDKNSLNIVTGANEMRR